MAGPMITRFLCGALMLAVAFAVGGIVVLAFGRETMGEPLL